MCLIRGSKKGNTKVLSWVKRQYLLARMAYPRSKDHRRVAFFQQLRAAAQDLQAILGRDPLIDIDLRASLSPLPHPRASDLTRELASIIVCEAALSFLNDDAILDHEDCFPPQLDFDAKSTYWLVNVACWAGSRALLDFLKARTPQISSVESPVTAAGLQCIPTAIWQGQRDIVQHILQLGFLTLPECDRHCLCPIEAAITVGDLDTVNLILEHVKTTSISKRLYTALNMARPKPDRPNDYLAILQRLLPELSTVTDLRPVALSALTIHIADTGGPAGVSRLAAHGLLSAYNVQVTRGQYSALDSPSQKGDVATIKKLFDVGYLDDVNPRVSGSAAIIRAAKMALLWGQVNVFEELKKHSSRISNSDEWLPHLLVASASSTLHNLQESVKSAEVILQKPIAETSVGTAQGTVGEATLERAIRFLKPANVEFILDMGIRLAREHQIIHMSWTYSRSHQVAFDTTQQLLAGYGLPLIVISA